MMEKKKGTEILGNCVHPCGAACQKQWKGLCNSTRVSVYGVDFKSRCKQETDLENGGNVPEVVCVTH